MRIAVLSDLHLGAETSAFASLCRGEPNQPFLDLMEALRPQGEKYDHLVLLGDFFDLSLVSFAEAWRAAKAFLQTPQIQNLTDRIIYVPGNHDFTMWHYFEQDIHVTRRVQATPAQDPEAFRYSVPGVLGADGALSLIGVNRGAFLGDKFSGGFFQGLWSGPSKEFAVAYPNLYVAGKDVTLLTHGQYFDGVWSYLGKLCLKGADANLDNEATGKLSISELVQTNYPTSVLLASAIGQSGIFSKLAQSVVEDVNQGDFGKVEAFKKAWIQKLEAELNFGGLFGWAKKLGSHLAIYLVDKLVQSQIEKLKQGEGARYNPDYVEEHLANIQAYLQISQEEFSKISWADPSFERLIFGHTHLPTGPTEKACVVPVKDSSRGVRCYNTGGWICDKQGDFQGAVAIYESDASKPWTMFHVNKSGASEPFDLD